MAEPDERRHTYDEYFAELRDDVRQIKKLLLGNGVPGALEQIRANTTDIEQLKKQPSAIKDNVRFAITVAMFAAAAAGWFLK
jgi:hypothetical protein